MYTVDEAREMARKHVEEKYGSRYGSLKKAAQDLNMSVASLADLRHGKGAPPHAVLRSMGLKRVFVYVEEKQS